MLPGPQAECCDRSRKPGATDGEWNAGRQTETGQAGAAGSRKVVLFGPALEQHVVRLAIGEGRGTGPRGSALFEPRAHVTLASTPRRATGLSPDADGGRPESFRVLEGLQRAWRVAMAGEGRITLGVARSTGGCSTEWDVIV